MVKRRLPKLCALCGEVAVDTWHCVAHTWASPPTRAPKKTNGVSLGPHHAYWVKRFTPAQVDELASHLERA